MLEAQNDSYGDGLASDALHPYMWALKPHYYDRDGYYNFPYTYGLLFALGLYAEFEKNPEQFRGQYDELLSMTGMDDGATLAKRFGIDVRTEAFWSASLGVLEQDINAFVQEVDRA